MQVKVGFVQTIEELELCTFSKCPSTSIDVSPKSILVNAQMRDLFIYFRNVPVILSTNHSLIFANVL